jgi:hypothetical protein
MSCASAVIEGKASEKSHLDDVTLPVEAASEPTPPNGQSVPAENVSPAVAL